MRDGASFSTRLVRAVQKGVNIYVALISFHKHEPSPIYNQFTMPDVPPPEQLLLYEELIRQALACVCHFIVFHLVVDSISFSPF